MALIPLRRADDGLFDARDGRRVDDYVSVRLTAQRFHKQGGLRARVAFSYDVAQIWAVEAGDVFVGMTQRELLDDVVAYLLVALAVKAAMGRSGKCLRRR